MQIKIRNLQKKIPIPQALILKAIPAALRQLDFDLQGLSIVFLGGRRMRTINKKYLGHDYQTDVLTFDLGEGQGEIIICPEVAQANALDYQTSTKKEIIRYVMHGILHLKGYDDHAPKDIIKMREMEDKLLFSRGRACSAPTGEL
jgi:rRNA maturation RNase YbeY